MALSEHMYFTCRDNGTIIIHCVRPCVSVCAFYLVCVVEEFENIATIFLRELAFDTEMFSWTLKKCYYPYCSTVCACGVGTFSDGGALAGWMLAKLKYTGWPGFSSSSISAAYRETAHIISSSSPA